MDTENLGARASALACACARVVAGKLGRSPFSGRLKTDGPQTVVERARWGGTSFGHLKMVVPLPAYWGCSATAISRVFTL